MFSPASTKRRRSRSRSRSPPPPRHRRVLRGSARSRPRSRSPPPPRQRDLRSPSRERAEDEMVIEPLAGVLERVLSALGAQGESRPKTLAKLTNMVRSLAAATCFVPPSMALAAATARSGASVDVLVARRIELTPAHVALGAGAILACATRHGLAAFPLCPETGGVFWEQLLNRVRTWAAGCTANDRDAVASELQNLCLSAGELPTNVVLELLLAAPLCTMSPAGDLDFSMLLLHGSALIPQVEASAELAAATFFDGHPARFYMRQLTALLLAHLHALPTHADQLAAWLKTLGAATVVFAADPAVVVKAGFGGKLSVRGTVIATKHELVAGAKTFDVAQRTADHWNAPLTMHTPEDLDAAVSRVESWLQTLSLDAQRGDNQPAAQLSTVDALSAQLRSLCIRRMQVPAESIVAKLFSHRLVAMDGTGCISYPCFVKGGAADPAWLADEARLIKLQLKTASERMPITSASAGGSLSFTRLAQAISAQHAHKRRRFSAAFRA